MPHPFSSRTAWDLTESDYAAAIRKRRAQGGELLDLTVSIPTTCGFQYDPVTLLAPLSDPAVLQYQPGPLGLLSARIAVADYYASHHATISPEHIILTASTSESYSYLFRLLCNPGDNVLVPRPGYPLFDYLAALDDVELRTYDNHYAAGWMLDVVHLKSLISNNTRAILLVSPNNPTGHFPQPSERAQLLSICAENNLALIVDEVFLDYLISNDLDSQTSASFATIQAPPVPIFILSGISKIAALPQMKVGWILCRGPQSYLSQAIDRIEVISDTFLSVSTPAQYALPTWLGNKDDMQHQIIDRINMNLCVLEEMFNANSHLQYLPPDAGWSVILRAQYLSGTSTFAVQMIDKYGLVVHPGAFYGLPDANCLVLSTIASTETFKQGIALLSEQFHINEPRW